MKRIVLLLALISLCGCETAKVTPLQRRNIEARDLQGRFEDAYKSTLQVFQDYGYVIKNSDYDSGVIQAETGVKSSVFGYMTNNEITATIEQFGENTVKERISLVRKSKYNTQYGQNEDSSVVLDPDFFLKIYDDIQKEMFIRQNLAK